MCAVDSGGKDGTLHQRFGKAPVFDGMVGEQFDAENSIGQFLGSYCVEQVAGFRSPPLGSRRFGETRIEEVEWVLRLPVVQIPDQSVLKILLVVPGEIIVRKSRVEPQNIDSGIGITDERLRKKLPSDQVIG